MNAMSDKLSAATTTNSDCEIQVHDARALIPDGVQAKIVLDAQVYTLRITRAGKLILTK
ncbi:hemin uptake protein HemP [Marivita sp. S0852]|uniref:hemin uptake protein HemP n=1 Tax=Marivita sp. S0852 TaxID=3373893 RepID=UPI00398232F6